jgi:hypothetical protein
LGHFLSLLGDAGAGLAVGTFASLQIVPESPGRCLAAAIRSGTVERSVF